MRTRDTNEPVKQQAIQHYHQKIPDQVPGKHLWMMAAVYRVTPQIRGQYALDTENLLSIDGPGCYWCEEPWTPTIGNQPCKGTGQ